MTAEYRTVRGWRGRRTQLHRLIRKHQAVVDTCRAELDIVDARIAEITATEPTDAKADGSTVSGSSGGGEAKRAPVVESSPDPSPEAS